MHGSILQKKTEEEKTKWKSSRTRARTRTRTRSKNHWNEMMLNGLTVCFNGSLAYEKCIALLTAALAPLRNRRICFCSAVFSHRAHTHTQSAKKKVLKLFRFMPCSRWCVCMCISLECCAYTRVTNCKSNGKCNKFIRWMKSSFKNHNEESGKETNNKQRSKKKASRGL